MAITIYANGDVHLGFWKDDKKNGFGRTYLVSECSVLEGTYVNGELEGEVFKYYHFGKYQGSWKDGAFHGKGTFNFYSGG